MTADVCFGLDIASAMGLACGQKLFTLSYGLFPQWRRGSPTVDVLTQLHQQHGHQGIERTA